MWDCAELFNNSALHLATSIDGLSLWIVGGICYLKSDLHPSLKWRLDTSVLPADCGFSLEPSAGELTLGPLP